MKHTNTKDASADGARVAQLTDDPYWSEAGDLLARLASTCIALCLWFGVISLITPPGLIERSFALFAGGVKTHEMHCGCEAQVTTKPTTDDRLRPAQSRDTSSRPLRDLAIH